MKTLEDQPLLWRVPGWALSLSITLVLGLATSNARAATGATSYTSSGYSLGQVYSGDALVFAPDDVHVRNMLSRLRVQSTDASLTTAEFQSLSGMQIRFQPDVIGTPFTWGDSFLIGVWQYTDGTLPPAEVTFD